MANRWESNKSTTWSRDEKLFCRINKLSFAVTTLLTSRREPAAGFISSSKDGNHDHVHGGAHDARGRRPVQVGGDPEGLLRSSRGGLQGVRRRRVLGDVAVRPHQGARPEYLRCVRLPFHSNYATRPRAGRTSRRGSAEDAPATHRNARQKTQTLRPETLQHGARWGGVNRPRLGTREARTRATETSVRRNCGRTRYVPRLARRIPSRPCARPSRVRVAPPRFADVVALFEVARRKSVLSCSFLGHDSRHRPTTLARRSPLFSLTVQGHSR